MKTAHQITDALEAFDTRHGSVVTAALAAYAEDMRELAARCEAEAMCPERPPVPPRPNPDGTRTLTVRTTPRGYTGMAAQFTDSARKAGEASQAYQTLAGLPDDE